MQYNKNEIGRLAKENHFVRDTLEKVFRLSDILIFISNDLTLFNSLLLKGGTAINLTIFDMPRLSVDIDLDFHKNIDREMMLEERKIINAKINKFMNANNYVLSNKSKQYHALDSFVYEYINTGGVKDNIKIEINYMNRCHIMPYQEKAIKLSFMDKKYNINTLNPIEIYGSKIVALLNRGAARDLYDVYNMIKYNLFNEKEKQILKKCVTLYSAIGSNSIPNNFNIESINNISYKQIHRDLRPVLRSDDKFDLCEAKAIVESYLKEILIIDENIIKFWDLFKNKKYQPDLLFQGEYLNNIINHPMAIWKCNN